MMVRFEKATAADASELARLSKDAFDHDAQYGAPGPGGPPGYDSARWQSKMMRVGCYYKILAEADMVGGVIVFRQGPGRYELGRMFISPARQNQGIGKQVFAFLRQAFPDARRWTLETPVWNLRNRHFYKKVGFVEIGLAEHDQVRFENSAPGHKA